MPEQAVHVCKAELRLAFFPDALTDGTVVVGDYGEQRGFCPVGRIERDAGFLLDPEDAPGVVLIVDRPDNDAAAFGQEFCQRTPAGGSALRSVELHPQVIAV